MASPEQREIIKHRKEIEDRLIELLKEAKSSFSLDDIKAIIYNENGFAAHVLAEIVPMFDTKFSNIDINSLMNLLMDAWNYFPHKSLNGLSPREMSLTRKK